MEGAVDGRRCPLVTLHSSGIWWYHGCPVQLRVQACNPRNNSNGAGLMSAKERSNLFLQAWLRRLLRRPAADAGLPVIPRFKLLKKLGEGGMASIFLGRQESTGREVAIKILAHHLQSNARWKDRFLDEARRLAELSHPNVVPVFDWGTHEGVGYIVMEYIRGGTLAQRLKTQTVTVRDAIQITQQIAAGLDFASEKGYVHRDIKPDNILFREDGSLCILDFGIAKESESNTTITSQGIPFGTGAYMSPEQAQPSGKVIDGRSDLYSLGIVLYEILTGTRPFDFRQYDAMKGFQMYLFAHVHSPPPPLPPAVSAFQPVLNQLLAKEPKDRFSRGNDVREALARLAATLPEQELARGIRGPGESTLLMSGPAGLHPDATPVAQHAGVNSAAGHAAEPARVGPEHPSGVAISLPDVPRKYARKAWTLAGAVAITGLSAGYLTLAPKSPAPDNTPVPAQAEANTPTPQPAAVKSGSATTDETDRITRVITQQLQAARELMQAEPGNLMAQQQLVARLNQILQLAPGHVEATTSLERVLQKQVAHTRAQLDSNRLDTVPTHLSLIASLSRDAAADLQSRYDAARKAEADNRQRLIRLAGIEQDIQRQLTTAQKQQPTQARETLLNTAGLTRDAMAMQLGEEEATRYRQQIASAYTDRIQQQIAREQLTTARRWLEQAETLFVSPTAVATLNNAIEQKQKQIAQRQQPKARPTATVTAAVPAGEAVVEKGKSIEGTIETRAVETRTAATPALNEQTAQTPAALTPGKAEQPAAPLETPVKTTEALEQATATQPATAASSTTVATPEKTEKNEEETPPAKPRVRTFGSF